MKTWQFLIVADDKVKHPSLAMIVDYTPAGEFSDAIIAIATTEQLAVWEGCGGPNPKTPKIDGRLSLLPIRITPEEAFAMIAFYPSIIDLEIYKQIQQPMPAKETPK